MIVKYSKKFPYAPFLNEDIGFETEVNATIFDGDEELILLALRKLKSIAEKFHKENNPGLYVEDKVPIYNENPDWSSPVPKQSPLPSIDYKAIERLERLIDDANVLYDLQLLQGQVAKYGLQDYYDEKLKKLTQ